jgi:hypothetical protein
MTVNPSAFLELVHENVADLTPAEQNALLSFAEGLDPSISIGALTSKLSRFLLDHESIDIRFDTHPLLRIAGQPIKLTPAAFITTLRNLVLTSQLKIQKDVGTPTKS